MSNGLTPAATTPTTGNARRLRQFQVVVVSLMVLLGAGSFWVLTQSRDNLAQASAHAAEYVRLTTVGTRLLQADAAAGKSFISAGATASRHHQRVTSALTDASTLLVASAAAQPEDAAVLSTVNAEILSYGRDLETARSLKGSDEGSRVLLAANTFVRDEILPDLSDLADRNAARVAELLTQQLGWLLPVFAWLCVAALLAISWVVARQSHRVVNLGLAAAIVATGTIAVLSGTAISAVASSAVTAREGDLAQLQAATRSENLVSDAHGVEVQSVVARTRPARYQEAWKQRVDEADATLRKVNAEDLLASLNAYTQAHARLAGLIAEERWEDAATLVADDARTSPGGAVVAFDAEASAVQDAAGAAVSQAASSHADGLLAQAVGTALLALGAAGLALWGLGQRLKEYR